jgi:steroid delta-isomerase-like uncharacterized protein
MTEQVERNAALARRWFEEVWNQKNPNTIRELVSADCIAHGTSETGGDLRGPEGFLTLQARLLNAFPDLHIDVQDVLATGDKIAVRWTGTMHHSGDGLGIAATGAEIKVNGIGLARIENGKLVEIWDSWDKLSMFQQIESAAKAKANSA